MPELPEVETVRRKLDELLRQRILQQVQVLRDKSFLGFSDASTELLQQQVVAVQRRAKILQIVLSGQRDLLIHLKMTGQLIFVDQSGERSGGGHPTADWVAQLPSKHTRVIFTFADGAQLFFNDQRVFGWIRSPRKQEVAREFAQYGPDINDPNLSVTYLLRQAQQRNIPIKQFIMDNAVICGVGNIYASESLFKIGLSPFMPARQVTKLQMTALLSAMQTIIARAIELGGTTFDGKYVGVDGFAGGFQHELQVYGREGLPCMRCARPIMKAKIAGRGTFYCSSCQK
jgi:formamidopyrimidine-DNA glycosylase